jgi:hypothetical protein
MPRIRALIPLVVSLAVLASRAHAQLPGRGALDALVYPRDSRILHFSSADPTHRNHDFRPIAPGETLTLVDHRGAGVVRRWWLTVAPLNHVALQR